MKKPVRKSKSKSKPSEKQQKETPRSDARERQQVADWRTSGTRIIWISDCPGIPDTSDGDCELFVRNVAGKNLFAAIRTRRMDESEISRCWVEQTHEELAALLEDWVDASTAVIDVDPKWARHIAAHVPKLIARAAPNERRRWAKCVESWRATCEHGLVVPQGLTLATGESTPTQTEIMVRLEAWHEAVMAMDEIGALRLGMLEYPSTPYDDSKPGMTTREIEEGILHYSLAPVANMRLRV